MLCIHLKCCLWTDSISWGKAHVIMFTELLQKKTKKSLNGHQQGSGWINWVISMLWNITHLYEKQVRYVFTDLEGVPDGLLSEKASFREMSWTLISLLKQNNKNSALRCPFVCMKEEKVGAGHLPVNLSYFGLSGKERRDQFFVIFVLHIRVFMHIKKHPWPSVIWRKNNLLKKENTKLYTH